MKLHFKLILIFLALFIVVNGAIAQISGIDAAGYPTIKAYGGGPVFNNAKATDFNVVENGQNMNATLTVQCSTVVRDPSVSVVLVIDKSESMSTPMGNGLQRLDWVKQGAKTFVQSLNFAKGTQVAVVSFDGEAYIECNFQTAAAPILDAIDKITVSGGATRYDPPLIDPNKGAITLLKTTPPWIKRMIIFLTDGLPNIQPSQQAIINQLIAEKIVLHAMFVTNEISNELSTIASNSGGQSFRANTQELINQFYRLLAEQIPVDVTYCWLAWQSPYVCTDAARNRTVQITHRPTNNKSNFSYLAPPQSVAGISLSTPSLPPFADIAPGQTLTQKFTITAVNSPIIVTGAFIVPSANFTILDWGGSPPPFTLMPNQSRALTVEFKQTAPRDIRNAQITIQGMPCSSPPLKVSGGATQISLITPNGGEIYSSCDSVAIEWTGVDPADKAILHYTDNNSLPWKLLTTNASGMRYIWRKPPVINNGKVRIAAITPRTDYSQPIAVYSVGIDTVAAAAVHSSGSLLYITGSFDKKASIGFPPNTQTSPISVNSPRAEEAFVSQSSFGLTRWAASGAIFLQPFAPYTLSRGTSVMIDEQSGEAFATGEIYRQTAGKHSIWVGQFKIDGATRWLKEISSYADIHASKIGVDSSSGNIFLMGYYSGDFTQTLANGANIYLSSPTPKKYFMLLDNAGRPTRLQDSAFVLTPKQLRDSLGNFYEFGAFRKQLICADTTISALGVSDGYIRKFGKVLSQSDESNGTFSSINPFISFKLNTVSVSSSNIGFSKDTTFEGILCNSRKTAAVVRNFSFSGGDSTDFNVIAPLLPIEIPADSCIPVTIRMNPPRIGKLATKMIASGDCISAAMEVTGIGSQQEAQISNMNWGKKRLLSNNYGEVYIVNGGTTPLTVTSISLKNIPESNFNPTFKQTPYILQAGATDTIRVIFTPQDTLQFMNYIVASFSELPQPVIGLLNGEGFLPKLRLNGYNFGVVKVGESSPSIGKIYLHNPSLTSSTAIKKVEIISNPGDFTFAINTLQRYDIFENTTDSSVVSVNFSPLTRGRREAVVKIYSDAAPGPLPDPTVEDTVHIVGYGSQIDALDIAPLNFGNIFSCDKPINNLIISNPDTASDSKISGFEIIGPDAAFFRNLSSDTTIPAGKALSLPIQFLPGSNRAYAATAHFYDSFDQEYNAPLNAVAESINIKFGLEPKKLVYKPGDNISLQVVASSDSRTTPNVTPIAFEIIADSKVAASPRIERASSAWLWSVASVNDAFIITGAPSSNSATMPLGEIASIKYSAFLGEDETTPVKLTVKTDAACIISETNDAILQIEKLCFTSARFVHTGKQYYLGLPRPQPARDEFTIPVGVGLSGNISIKIIDQLGRTILEAMNVNLGEGGYEFAIPAGMLPNGVYTITYNAGQFFANSPLIIAK